MSEYNPPEYDGNLNSAGERYAKQLGLVQQDDGDWYDDGEWWGDTGELNSVGDEAALDRETDRRIDEARGK